MGPERGEAGTIRLGAGRAAVLWGLFFLICFGLGYPTLNRYDAHELGPDWQSYYSSVLRQDTADDFPFNARVLVPAVARPFYLAARGRCGTWNPVWFGMLMANSLFMATAAFLLLQLGVRVLGDLPVALFACLLYLLDFVVPNLWLSGMVDSAEACLLLLMMWALFYERWWMLPLMGLLGGMAKQSFLPLGTAFAGTWWLMTELPARRYRRLVWVAALALVSAGTIALVERAITGEAAAPWTVASKWSVSGTFLANLLRCVKDQQFWFVFAWLLPLGVWRLNRLPRRWVAASLGAGAAAVALGGYTNMLGAVCRPLYATVGPMLAISAASLLAERKDEAAAG